MNTSQELKNATRELASLVTQRDRLVADTHDLNLFVAMWRTFKRNSRIIEMNNRIADLLDYVETLEEVSYTLSPDAYAVIDDHVFDLIDWLAMHNVTVTGHCDGRTVYTDERVLVVDRDGVEQYRAVCGDEMLDHELLKEMLDGLDAHLTVNGKVFNTSISKQACEVLDWFAAGDCEVTGEIDGLTVTSARIPSRYNGYRITAQRDGVTVYTVESTGLMRLDRHLIVRRARAERQFTS